MSRYKDIDKKPQEIKYVQRGLIIVAIIAVFCIMKWGLGLLTFGPEPMQEPDPRITIPREMPLETMELNFDTIHSYLKKAEAVVSVNNPKGLIFDANMVIKPGSSAQMYDAMVPAEKAAATVEKYPHLFDYDPSSKEFTFKATYPGKHYVVMPAWLVASMIDNNVLIINP